MNKTYGITVKNEKDAFFHDCLICPIIVIVYSIRLSTPLNPGVLLLLPINTVSWTAFDGIIYFKFGIDLQISDADKAGIIHREHLGAHLFAYATSNTQT
jgi:hypothetical protein